MTPDDSLFPAGFFPYPKYIYLKPQLPNAYKLLPEFTRVAV